MNRQQLAEALGVAASTISRDSRKGMPVTCVACARRWRQENLGSPRTPSPNSPDASPITLLEARVRRETAAAATLELKLSVARGELGRPAIWLAAWRLKCAAVRESALAVPGRLSASIANKSEGECYLMLTDAMHDLLRNISGTGE